MTKKQKETKSVKELVRKLDNMSFMNNSIEEVSIVECSDSDDEKSLHIDNSGRKLKIVKEKRSDQKNPNETDDVKSHAEEHPSAGKKQFQEMVEEIYEKNNFNEDSAIQLDNETEILSEGEYEKIVGNRIETETPVEEDDIEEDEFDEKSSNGNTQKSMSGSSKSSSNASIEKSGHLAEDSRKSETGSFTGPDHDKRGPLYVKYDELSENDKYRLAVYAVLVIKRTASVGFFTKFFAYLKNLFQAENEKFFTSVEVKPFIFQIIDHLRVVGIMHEGIFRLSGQKIIYEQMPVGIQNGKEYNLDDYIALDLASSLKAYIRKILNGFVPIGACTSIYAIHKENIISKNKTLEAMFPLIFFGKKRKCLLEVMKLYRTISKNDKITRMTLGNLIVSSAPTFFPEIKNEDMGLAFTQKSLVELLFTLDFENVPTEILKKAQQLSEKEIKGRVEGDIEEM